MHKRPDQYVRIDRYTETYLEDYDEPTYSINMAAGYTGLDNNIVQKAINITMDDLKRLIIVAAAKLDDLLDEIDSVTEIK